ncbi:MAG: serine/threonine protein kinase [Candidatus Schekmanbacteria bacterium]|nr:serine/threonine protein kinase [Candidatus Schekmanbacteria bacterium]
MPERNLIVAQLSPGAIIAGRYAIVRLLGSGGMGATYEARDQRDGRAVAIKELSLARITDWKVLELFEREARALRGLDHPKIPSYVAYVAPDDASGGAPRSFFLVRELAKGRSLAELAEQGWRPDEDAVRDVARQILEVLVYLQSRVPPVIHRDIKPENLIRDDDGMVRLVDFGSVRDSLAGQTFASTVVGTYGYMAPEQLACRAVPATDLYGLGATLIHLLTGQRPTALPMRRMRIDFRGATNASGAFAEWVAKLVEPAVEDRFQSAREAAEMLSTLDRRDAPPPAIGGQSRPARAGLGQVVLDPPLGRLQAARNAHHEDPPPHLPHDGGGTEGGGQVRPARVVGRFVQLALGCTLAVVAAEHPQYKEMCLWCGFFALALIEAFCQAQAPSAVMPQSERSPASSARNQCLESCEDTTPSATRLLACIECGGTVSKDATKCPNCKCDPMGGVCVICRKRIE